MRKLLFAAMAVVMVMGISRTAEALTANTLLSLCESKENTGCLYFLAGVSLGIQTANLARDAGTRFCLPKKFTSGQLRKMFIKSANERPEMLHEEAMTFIGIVTLNPFFRPTDKGSCPD